MPIIGRIGGSFLGTERYLSRSGKRLLGENRVSVPRILHIEDRSGRVGQYEDEAREILALAATHAGHPLRLSDRVTVKVAPPLSPIPTLGQTAVPGVRMAEVTLHPLLDREVFTSAELRGMFDVLLQSGIAFREIPDGDAVANPLDIVRWLGRVYAAEFAHVADLLGRNRQGELNGLQLAPYLLDHEQREQFRSGGFRMQSFPAMYSSLGLAETVDASMQTFLEPLEDYLPEMLILYFNNFRQQKWLGLLARGLSAVRTTSFKEFLGAYMNGICQRMAKVNFIDFAIPYLPGFFDVPHPHVQAKDFQQLGHMKFLIWWVEGYMRGDRDLATYRVIRRLLLLGRLSGITYHAIPEGSDQYVHALEVGPLIAAALYIEASHGEQEHRGGMGEEGLARQMRHATQELADVLRSDVRPLSEFPIDLGTHFAGGEMLPLEVRIPLGGRRFGLDTLLDRMEGNPVFRKSPAGRRLALIARTGSVGDLKEWILEFQRSEAILFALPNPLYQAARVLIDADSPSTLEYNVRFQAERIIRRLPRDFLGRENVVLHLGMLSRFEDEGWAARRAPHEIDYLWGRLGIDLEKAARRIERRRMEVKERKRYFTFDDLEELERVHMNELRPLFVALDQ